MLVVYVVSPSQHGSIHFSLLFNSSEMLAQMSRIANSGAKLSKMNMFS